MQVTKESNPISRSTTNLVQYLFDGPHLWLELLTSFAPVAPIEVLSERVQLMIAPVDTIRVNHGDEDEDKATEQVLSHRVPIL